MNRYGKSAAKKTYGDEVQTPRGFVDSDSSSFLLTCPP